MGKKSKRGGEEETSDQNIQLPRKRGRPRKNVIEKTETNGPQDSEVKKARAHDEEEEEDKDKGIESSSFSGGADAVEDGDDKKKEKESVKRKGRRKGQPRKSS